MVVMGEWYWRFAIMPAFVVIAWALPEIAPATPPGYEQRDTWQQTMLASRTRLASLLANQQRQMKTLAVGPWYTTGAIASRRFSDVLFPEEGVDLAVRDDGRRPLWRRRDDWPDGWVHMLENHRQATYLFRTITAQAAGSVTAHVGSDDAMKIWLNGNEVFADEKLGLRRHQHSTVDLALVRGENRLLLKAYNETSTAGFYFSLVEDAIFQVWRQIEKDFPVQWDWVLQDTDHDFRQWFYSNREKKAIADTLLSAGSAPRPACPPRR